MIKKALNSARALYSPEFPRTITYMLQSTEYRIWPYLKWFWRTDDFSKVRSRRELDKTPVAVMILRTITLGIILEIAGGIVLILLTIGNKVPGGWGYGLAAIIAFPAVWSQLICLPVALARLLVIDPKERQAIQKSKKLFAESQAIKIAVAGSYGKTSMKELLKTVLSQGKKVAATPANKNVPLAHLKFARSLSDKEDILIVEFGEGGPGDVPRFADTLGPSMAVITGIAPAHLDRYKTIASVSKDIFSLENFVDKNKIYVNREWPEADKDIPKGFHTYDRHGALGWQVKDVKLSVTGLKFKLKKDDQTLDLTSSLIGRHQIGPLAMAAALGKELGLSDKQVEEGIKQAEVYEHRMQPYQLNGAWIIDDTYNGNLEGIRAGTALLKELEGRRKIYVTPGLVDQGKDTKKIHEEVGRLIAGASPDIVVLMENSITDYIESGLKQAKYRGLVQRQPDPLAFYSNLSSFVASGDIALMQNDWTDNYA